MDYSVLSLTNDGHRSPPTLSFLSLGLHPQQFFYGFVLENCFSCRCPRKHFACTMRPVHCLSNKSRKAFYYSFCLCVVSVATVDKLHFTPPWLQCQDNRFCLCTERPDTQTRGDKSYRSHIPCCCCCCCCCCCRDAFNEFG